MKYVCNVKEISYGTIEVEANSRQEAQDKADTSFIKNGEVNVEELMKVNPQLYFEKAQDQKSINKLEDAGVDVDELANMDWSDRYDAIEGAGLDSSDFDYGFDD